VCFLPRFELQERFHILLKLVPRVELVLVEKLPLEVDALVLDVDLSGLGLRELEARNLWGCQVDEIDGADLEVLAQLGAAVEVGCNGVKVAREHVEVVVVEEALGALVQ
jgi:hypothetical protein